MNTVKYNRRYMRAKVIFVSLGKKISIIVNFRASMCRTIFYFNQP